MYTKINMPKGLNSGSSFNLVSYLDKEEKGYFFNSNSEVVFSSEVVNSIDSNCNRGVRKDDDKFYMLTFSPSEYELKSIVGREVNSFNELTYDEKIKLTNSMKEYTSEAMTLYAKSFNRNTIKDNKDLLYFGRIETQRTYDKFDKEVLNKEAKVGETKTGLNVHIHVIVSRKSFDKKTLLSPNIRFRNCTFEKNKNQPTNNKVTRGFNITDFTTKCHDAFKDKFNINYNNNQFDYTSNKSFYTKNNTVLSQAKKCTSFILQGELNTEREMISNVQQGINFASSLSKGNMPNINSIKSLAEKSIIKNELQVEKQMLNSVLQSASMIKSITSLTNPATAPVEIIKTVYKAVSNLTQLFNSLSK